MITQPQQPLLNKAMMAVMSAQFFSAFGDNALLFATLALIKYHLYPEWSQPVLQMVFVATYIILAPFVGQIADSFAKGHVMMFANSMKLFGALIICLGWSPFVGYALVGVGAAAYSPAKYGILGEITSGDHLVKANGLIEASTIAAILIGSVAGGMVADLSIIYALALCALVYGVAIVANLFIPRLSAAKTDANWNVLSMVKRFFASCTVLWRDQNSRFSLIGTSLFWGAGVTLRFLLVLWVPAVLGITNNSVPTLLNAIVAVGIVVGAGCAAKMVTLSSVTRCIPAGILMGIAVTIFTLQSNINSAYILLIIIGMLGGFFIVPLNALLQDVGKQTVGAGNAIAVQNLAENTAMLLMLGLFSVVVSFGVPVVWIGAGFGLLFALAISLLWFWLQRQKLSSF